MRIMTDDLGGGLDPAAYRATAKCERPAGCGRRVFSLRSVNRGRASRWGVPPFYPARFLAAPPRTHPTRVNRRRGGNAKLVNRRLLVKLPDMCPETPQPVKLRDMCPQARWATLGTCSGHVSTCRWGDARRAGARSRGRPDDLDSEWLHVRKLYHRSRR